MIKQMTFSIMYWNIWLNNQLSGKRGAITLLDEIDRILEKYQPDFIGLNEVLQTIDSREAFVLEYIEQKHGYKFVHYAHSSPSTPEWYIGSAFLSRIKPVTVETVAISTDSAAIIRGYHGHEVKAVVAKVTLGPELTINIITAHPLHLRQTIIANHYKGTKKLETIVHTKEYAKNTILGGDINEPGFMPNSLRKKVGETMNFRTGTIRNPTWKHNAHKHLL